MRARMEYSVSGRPAHTHARTDDTLMKPNWCVASAQLCGVGGKQVWEAEARHSSTTAEQHAMNVPMLHSSEEDSQRGGKNAAGGLPYTLDHTEYAMDFSDGELCSRSLRVFSTCRASSLSTIRSCPSMFVRAVRCEPAQLWLATFILSGIGGYLVYELHLCARAAKGVSFLVPFFGYVAAFTIGLVLTACHGHWPVRAHWTRRMALCMLLSSLGNGAAQAADFVAITQAGVQLYTILHSSVTFFAALFAVLCLRRRLTAVQFAVLGVVLESYSPVYSSRARPGSFAMGLACAG